VRFFPATGFRFMVALMPSAVKKPVATANASTHPLDADDATWAAVEATHGSLAACSLAHVQALAVASAAAAAKYRGAGDHRKTFKSL
jgi:hypothetical protein